MARRPSMENGETNSGSNPKGRPRVVVVGSGFAGFTCARELERRLGPEDAELVLASPTDYLLYSPLLPEVATGAQDARNIAVPLHGALKRTRIILGDTMGVDLEARTCVVSPPNASKRVVGWDRLVLAPGGVTRSFPNPRLPARARGFKSLGEALYLRDHVLRQLELADASDDPTSGGRAAHSWWWARGTSAPSLRRRCSTSPARRWRTIRDWNPGTCAGCSSTPRRGCCQSSANVWERPPSVCSGGEGSRSGSRPP